MKRLDYFLGLGLASWIGFLGGVARAEQYPRSITLAISPLVTSPEGRCPKTVTLNEISEPYEGGYQVKGWANLKTIAGQLTLSNRDEFSTTWVADLKPELKQCKASAGGLYDRDESVANHLRLRLTGGKVYLILDMTGLQDANGYTPTIDDRRVGVRNGNAFWQWAGTD